MSNHSGVAAYHTGYFLFGTDELIVYAERMTQTMYRITDHGQADRYLTSLGLTSRQIRNVVESVGTCWQSSWKHKGELVDVWAVGREIGVEDLVQTFSDIVVTPIVRTGMRSAYYFRKTKEFHAF